MEYDSISEEYDAPDDLPEDVDARLAALEAEIERIDTKRHTYDPDNLARSGVFVVLNHDGTARIERGFVRPEDEAQEPEAKPDGEGYAVTEDGEIIEDGDGDGVEASEAEDEDAEEDDKPLSDLLVRDLTAHRTLGLRLALGEQPDIALIAVTHALAAQTFYRRRRPIASMSVPPSVTLASHADGIEDTAAAKTLADRHAAWAADPAA